MRAQWEVRLRAFCGRRGKQRPDLPARDDLVDGSVLHGLLGRQDEVAVGVLGHALERLPCMAGDDPVHQLPVANELLSLDLDVDGLALRGAVGLEKDINLYVNSPGGQDAIDRCAAGRQRTTFVSCGQWRAAPPT